MNDQALRQLLVNADADAGAIPATSIDLASSVQRRLRRRRQSQVAGGAVVLCAMLAAVIFVRVSPKPGTLAVDNSSKTRAELSMIRMQADSQTATVNRLMQYQHSLDVQSKAARKFDRGQPLNRLQQQRESA